MHVLARAALAAPLKAKTDMPGSHTPTRILPLVCLFLSAAGFELLAASRAAEASHKPFVTLPPGSELPSAAACTNRVRAATGTREHRPENVAANRTAGGQINVRIDGASDAFNATYAARVKGNFVGTTQQVLLWGACHWGLDGNITMARAVSESTWRQGFIGDQGQSFGLLQVKRTVHDGTWPTAQRSSAFNVDYANAWQRACFEGDFTWLGNGYRAGDVWGCVGAWYSGNWWDSGARDYIASVQRHLADKPWNRAGF